MRHMPTDTSQTFHDAFGRYLLEKGLITQEDLKQAYAYVLQRNQRVGQFAIQKELLTPEQVSSLVALQRHSRKFIGELAVEQGLLTRAALDDLLFSQTVHSATIGEALLAAGSITSEQFASAMQEHLWLEAEKLRVLWDSLASLPEREILPVVACALELAFARFTGQMVKVENLCSLDEDDCLGACWALCFKLRGADWMECVLCISTQLVDRVQANAQQLCSQDGSDCCSVFMDIVARYLGQELEARGIPVESWKVHAHPAGRTPPRRTTGLSLTADVSDTCEDVSRQARLKVLVTLSCSQCPSS